MANELYREYSFDLESNRVPVAIILPPDQEVVIGSIVKLDGRSSIDPENVGLTYTWSFRQVPIGSQVELFGFTNLEDDASIVTFAPDVVGPYDVQLVVSDGSLTSDPAIGHVDVRVILVPHHQGFIPDASFIWNYLSDFWKLVDGRRKFEVFWSGAIQIVASEMLKLYQYDYNKSIRDIQEVFQRRWLSFSPGLAITRSKVSYILADDAAGTQANTLVLDPLSGLPLEDQPGYTNLIAIPTSEGSFEKTSFGSAISAGRISKLGERAFTLIRGNQVQRSINYAEDGQVTIGNTDFVGSGFSSDMVGATLRILSGGAGVVLGDFPITAYTSSTLISVDVSGTGSPNWTANASSIEYTVLPAVSTFSGFFADLQQVPAGLDSQAWRLSATLISSEYDFEGQGVSDADVIEVEITRTDLGLYTTVYAQVVAVDRDRLGFVMNLKDLADGEAGGWFTNDVQASMAADLQVRGLLLAPDGSLVYTDQAGAIYSTVNSLKFRRTYFERELTADTEVNLGPFSILIRPVQVLRNRRIPVDARFISAPVLQEYIKQPEVIEVEGGYNFVTEGGQVSSTRKPFILVENLDFIIDDEAQVSGSCNLEAGVDEIEIPYGDLIDRSIREHDTVVVTVGASEQEYDVRRVLAADRLRVYPTPTETKTAVPFRITRQVTGKYIRFIRDIFTKTNPAPPRLWSEITYFDNNDLVEDNFGVLVGVTQEDIERSNANVPYKSAVAGLMYALTNGPTVSNLSLAAQILLGLPFTQSAGVITEINEDYRKREDGSPLFGRILVEARDKNNTPLGITNIYLYPHGRQIPDPDNPGEWLPAVPELSGIAINSETGKEFAVGDAVSQFTVLSKGLTIQEYLTTPDWQARLVAQGDHAAILRQYHSMQLLVNSDLISASDIDFVAKFVRQTKPHYTIFTSALLKSIEEFVEVEEGISFGRQVQFFETAGMGVPSAVKFDDRDENEALLTYEGNFYSRYLSGIDLDTTKDSDLVVSLAGGFITARPALTESHDEPFALPGDLLVIDDGPNSGRYTTLDVVDDQTLQVDLAGGNFETASITGSCTLTSTFDQVVVPGGGLLNRNIETGDVLEVTIGATVYPFDVAEVVSDTLLRTTSPSSVSGSGTFVLKRRFSFSIYRPLRNPIWAGQVVVTTGDGNVMTIETVATATGIVAAGVAVGDLLVFADLASGAPSPSRKYTVVGVNPSITSPSIFVIPDPVEAGGTYSAWIVREGLMTRNFVEPFGVASPNVHRVVTVAGDARVFFQGTAVQTDWLNFSLTRPGDLLFLDPLDPTPYLVLEVKESGKQLLVTPKPTVTTVWTAARLERPTASNTPISVDFLDRIPADYLVLDLVLSGSSVDTLSTNAGSPDVTSTAAEDFIDMGIVPGDYVVMLQGPDSTLDVGHGAGVFAIQELTATDTLRLADNLNGTGNFRYGLRRKRRNEG